MLHLFVLTLKYLQTPCPSFKSLYREENDKFWQHNPQQSQGKCVFWLTSSDIIIFPAFAIHFFPSLQTVGLLPLIARLLKATEHLLLFLILALF